MITLLGAYMRPEGETVWSGGLVELLGEFGFSNGAARVALTRLVRRGLLSRVRSGRLVHYHLTPRCEHLLAEGDGRIFTFGHPRNDSSTWTVLWHQIPEDRRLERSQLARRLRFLGFGQVQDGLWVSPHDHEHEVAELLGELGVSEHATMFLARTGPVPGLSALVARAWDLVGLAERYEAFCAGFSRYLSPGARTRLSDREAFAVRTWLMHLFRGFPQLDPELPEELVPLTRPRSRAAATFRQLFEALAEPAQRHFDMVVLGFEADSGSSRNSGQAGG